MYIKRISIETEVKSMQDNEGYHMGSQIIYWILVNNLKLFKITSLEKLLHETTHEISNERLIDILKSRIGILIEEMVERGIFYNKTEEGKENHE